MCGRFSLAATPQELIDHFHLDSVPPLTPSYNIAPSQGVAVVRVRPGHEWRELAILQWGLIPFWADELTIGSHLINARAEGIAEKPAFRDSFKHRRGLVAADGFFEWKGMGKSKQPYYFHLKSGRLMALAALWDRWTPPDGAHIETCAVVTTEPNELCGRVHDRMPVILPESDYDFWLDPKIRDTERLSALLKPYSAEEMACTSISDRVNSPYEDGPDLIRPIAEQLDMLM
jgi:putative SOS response-associated peptidase YedK